MNIIILETHVRTHRLCASTHTHACRKAGRHTHTHTVGTHAQIQMHKYTHLLCTHAHRGKKPKHTAKAWQWNRCDLPSMWCSLVVAVSLVSIVPLLYFSLLSRGSLRACCKNQHQWRSNKPIWNHSTINALFHTCVCTVCFPHYFQLLLYSVWGSLYGMTANCLHSYLPNSMQWCLNSSVRCIVHCTQCLWTLLIFGFYFPLKGCSIVHIWTALLVPSGQTCTQATDDGVIPLCCL